MSDRPEINLTGKRAPFQGAQEQAGKDRSNSMRCVTGFLPITLSLPAKVKEAIDNLVDSYYERFQPQDSAEAALIDTMGAAFWRMGRLWATEKCMMNEAIEEQTSGDSITCIAGAFGELAETQKFQLLQRYEAHAAPPSLSARFDRFEALAAHRSSTFSRPGNWSR